MRHMAPFRSSQKLAICSINKVWHTVDRRMHYTHIYTCVILLRFHLYATTPQICNYFALLSFLYQIIFPVVGSTRMDNSVLAWGRNMFSKSRPVTEDQRRLLPTLVSGGYSRPTLSTTRPALALHEPLTNLTGLTYASNSIVTADPHCSSSASTFCMNRTLSRYAL